MKSFAKRYLIWLTVLTGIVLTGCTREDESDCIDTLEVAFRFTRNNMDLFQPDVHSISLFVFDKDGLFVEKHDEYRDEVLTSDYLMRLNLEGGDYTLVTWGGLSENHFNLLDTNGNVGELKKGITTIDDLQLRIAYQTKNYLSGLHNVVDYKPGDLFYGSEFDVNVPHGTGKSKKITIDLKRYSTQIRLIMSGLPLPTRGNPYSQLHFDMEAPNGGYDFRDNFENTSNTYTYIAQFANADADGKLTMDIYTLKLGFDRGNDFEIYSAETSKTIFSADLLEDFIRKDARYNTQAKVDYEDYFEIRIELDTNFGFNVWVNGWKVGKTDNEIQ